MTLLLKWCGSALLVGVLASAGNAQQERSRESQPTDQAEQREELSEPERMLRHLEESEKKADQTLARQWQGLIRQRQWVDVSGKHKVFAKYLAHDPEMKWMELLTVSRRGDKTETRRVKVAIDKFGKTERSLIKRIALIRPRVEAATADTASDDRFDSRSPDRTEDRAAERFDRREQVGEQFEAAYARESRSRVESAETFDARQPVEQRGLYESQPGTSLPGTSLRGTSLRATSLRATTPRSVNFDPEQPNLIDSAPWRLSFDVFRQNLSARRSGDGRWRLSWGELTGLQNAFAAALEAERAREGLLRGELSRPEAVQLADLADAALVELGEVVWETTLPTPVYGPRARSDYGLAALPEPFRLVLRTEEQDGGDYAELQVGQQVQFIGRFATVMGEEDYPTIVLRIRFPASLSVGREGREIDRRVPP